MSSKAFRRSYGSKLKPASSTFISLHFNKSDEDQLEISYKNDKKETKQNTCELTQSNFYLGDAKKETEEANDKSSVLSKLKLSKSYSNNLVDVLKESPESQLPKGSRSNVAATSEQNGEFQKNAEADLSPAIEAAEVLDGDTFNHYINDELEKAKCDKSDLRKETPLSPFSFLPYSKITNTTDGSDTSIKRNHNFCSIFQNVFDLIKYFQNSVKLHLLISVLACVCAPVPSWLSGFLVGTILSSSFVYWLCKPRKNKKLDYSFNIVSPSATNVFNNQEECCILKGWMNELPSTLSYCPERYHVSCTRSVYVRLEGASLRFSFPQKDIPKRAAFNESRYDRQFIHQQHYDITDAVVELLPQGLSNKRLWRKKYPICLRIANPKRMDVRKLVPRMNGDNEIVIYLFARTDRDKSLWYSRLLKASRGATEDVSGTQSVDEEDFVRVSLSREHKFEMYMSALLSPVHSTSTALTWLNVLIGRLFFDFLVEDVWAQLVSEKIQKKLNRIKLPFFLSELTVRDIHLGSALPKIHSASDPCVDERGLWIDVDLSYDGSFHMTLETKLNLDRLKPGAAPFEEQMKPPGCNSDDDTSSSDDDSSCSPSDTNEESSTSGKKLLKLVDKLAQSSYFQQATKNRYVKRAMTDLSNTSLILTVEVQWLTGTLAINIPPWPTDRLWYGFRRNPSLSITARPKLGQHAVTLTPITEWIEKKLTSEFQKVLVMPNMDDLIIPLMQDLLQVP